MSSSLSLVVRDEMLLTNVIETVPSFLLRHHWQPPYIEVEKSKGLLVKLHFLFTRESRGVQAFLSAAGKWI
jgi:hypothetical protein